MCARACVVQAITLGVFPRFAIKHTDKDVEGQVYIGPVNWFLMTLCLIITVAWGLKETGGLGEPVELANAYGIAVTTVFFMTTVLVTLFMIMVWELNLTLVLSFFLFFGAYDGNILAANLNKVPKGGWCGGWRGGASVGGRCLRSPFFRQYIFSTHTFLTQHIRSSC